MGERFDTSWGRRQGADARSRAQKSWGAGWAHLSEKQRESAIALEVVTLLVGQDEDHASPQVLRLQHAAREALGWSAK